MKMKKFLIKTQIVVSLLICILYKSQDNSISSAVLTPVANQTGVPDISFPLVTLPAAKDFTLNFGLIYNPNAYKPGHFSGQIARNWTIFGSNFTVTRQIMGSYPDEYLPIHSEWDDIYYYNLNGEQGSFKMERIGTFPNETYIVKKLTPSNINIETERIQTTYSWNVKHIKSFTIIDSRGFKYFFEDYDTQQVQTDYNSYGEARNTFYVTKIVDQNSKPIITFQNKQYTKYKENAPNIIESITFLPETIITNYGKLKFEQVDGGPLWSNNDRYYIGSLTLNDNKGLFISKYKFEINKSTYKYFDIDMYQTFEPQTVNVRYLNSVKKLDKYANIIESSSFSYTYSPPPTRTWDRPFGTGSAYEKGSYLMNGLLSTVSDNKSATKTTYQFGAHTIKLNNPIDYNSPSGINYIQSLDYGETAPFSFKKKTDSIWFDSKVSKKYYLTNLQKTPNSRIYIKFYTEETYPWGSNPENPWKGGVPSPDPKLAYKVENFIRSYPVYPSGEVEIESLFAPYIYIVPSNGLAYLEITGSGGNGWFEIYEKDWLDPPYLLINKNAISDTGVKIEQIKYFVNEDGQYNPVKTVDFDYSFVNEPEASSGKSVLDEEIETIIYTNIKVTESDKQGYTRFYYNVPSDYPTYPHPTIPNAFITPNFSYTKKGVLDKKEIYRSNNTKINSSEVNYTFPVYNPSDTDENKIPSKISSQEISYDETGNTLTTSSEQSFNQENNNLMSNIRTSADGIVTETNYKYAAEKGNAKLLGAGMHSVPLEVTQKQNNIETKKVETFYDHSGNYFPSSVKTSGIGGVTINEEKNDIYDTMGNVLQSSTKTGIPTAYIYGYSSTELIARIEGATYEAVMNAYGLPYSIEGYKSLEIYIQSNNDVDDASEELLRQKLDAFRLNTAFKDYQITTYTHDQLIGIKSVTTPSGNKEYYYYDDANRMIRVEDINHNVIKENKYKQYLGN